MQRVKFVYRILNLIPAFFPGSKDDSLPNRFLDVIDWLDGSKFGTGCCRGQGSAVSPTNEVGNNSSLTLQNIRSQLSH